MTVTGHMSLDLDHPTQKYTKILCIYCRQAVRLGPVKAAANLDSSLDSRVINDSSCKKVKNREACQFLDFCSLSSPCQCHALFLVPLVLAICPVLRRTIKAQLACIRLSAACSFMCCHQRLPAGQAACCLALRAVRHLLGQNITQIWLSEVACAAS